MVGRALTDVYQRRTATFGDVALEVRALSVDHASAPGGKAIADVGFSVRRGEIIGLAGLAGAGRTEVLRSLFGLYPGRANGEIWIEGAPVEIRSPGVAKRCKMALLTENRRAEGLVMSFPVRQNITLASLGRLSRHFLLRPDIQRRLSVGQVNTLNIRPKNVDIAAQNLSGGNQQKVILGKWLLRDLSILLLDEPTQGIDVSAKVEIYRLMDQLTEQGLAIVWVSSELPELLAMSDRIVVLAGGRMRGELGRAEATPERVMALATDFSSANYPGRNRRTLHVGQLQIMNRCRVGKAGRRQPALVHTDGRSRYVGGLVQDIDEASIENGLISRLQALDPGVPRAFQHERGSQWTKGKSALGFLSGRAVAGDAR
jgi:ABC-type sugar transport system ATPase subunit